jgi:hypothetical protein
MQTEEIVEEFIKRSLYTIEIFVDEDDLGILS